MFLSTWKNCSMFLEKTALSIYVISNSFESKEGNLEK